MKLTQRLEESRRAGDTAAVSLEFFVPDSADGAALLCVQAGIIGAGAGAAARGAARHGRVRWGVAARGRAARPHTLTPSPHPPTRLHPSPQPLAH